MTEQFPFQRKFNRVPMPSQRTPQQDDTAQTVLPTIPQDLTPSTISKAIPGSIGSIDEIAKRLGRKRIEVARFVAKNPEIKELIDDEKAAAVERVMKSQYDDAMDGNQQARESFIKMVSGFFSKEDKKTSASGPQTKIVIQMDTPAKTVKSFDPASGEIIELDAETLTPVVVGEDGDVEDDNDN